MIWTIAKKELLVHIKSMRFGIALVLCSSVIALSAYVSGLDYAKRLSAYNSVVERHRQALRQVKVYSYLRPVVDLPPAPLSIFSRGVERNLPHSITLSHAHIPTVLSGEMEKSPLSLFSDSHFFSPKFTLDIFQYSTENPLLSALSSFDIASVIGILLSLFALLLTFDAVSGERERGVLALELSNPVSRGEVFLGKYLGGLLALLFPLGIGFAIVLLVMGLSPSIKLGPGEISGVALVFGISLLYVSSFLMLGLFVSSSTKEASTSLIVLLVVWAVFVVVVPSGTGYFLSGRFPRDAWGKLQREVDALWREFRKKEGEIKKEHPFRGFTSITTQMGDGKMSVLVGSSEALLSILEQNKRIEPLRVEYALKEWRLYQEHLRPLKRWASLVKEVSRISPASQYSNAISAVAGTDLEGYESFVRQARTYREKLVEFLRDKFGTLRYFTPIKREEMMPEEKVRELWRGGFSSFSWDDVEPVDISGLPSFVISRPGPTEGLGRASVDIGLLALFNVLFFLLGYLMFLRYDVRWS